MELWLDGAGTHALPPAAIDTSAALYTVVGPRVVLSRRWGLASFSGQYGQGVGAIDARWFSGELAASGGHRVGRLMLRGDADLMALDYTTPFSYRIVAAGLAPGVAGTVGSFGVTVTGTARGGQWWSDAPDTTGTMGGMTNPAAQVSGNLGIAGASVKLGHALGPAYVAAEAEALSVVNGAVDGAYTTGTLEARVPVASAQLQLAGTVQQNPFETEWGYGITAAWAVRDGVVLQVAAGRTVTDPTYGAQGSFSASLGLSWRLGQRTVSVRPPVARPGAWTDAGRRVEFRLPAARAREVTILGDFTGWEPLPMRHEDGDWAVTVALEPGIHHFGFMVDGTWFVPEDAPGVAEDDWGRENASIVIEARPGDEAHR